MRGKIKRLIFVQMTYPAGIIIEDPDQPVFRKSGQVRICGNHMIFEAEGKAIEMPIAGCDIELGGTAHKQAYVTHPKIKGTTFQINDLKMFRESVFDDCAAASMLRREKANHNNILWGTVAALAVAIIVPFYMIFIERDYLVGVITDAVPPRYDIEVGDLAIASTIMGGVIDDPAILADLKRMTAPLVAAADTQPFEYNFYIVNDDAVNAFALPGGHIVINSGLIAKTDRPEELLGVIAHEIAHINERHSMKRIMHGISTWVFMSLLGADPNHIVALLGDNAERFASRSYSRAHEAEADSEGFKYLMDANIDPRGLRGFFEILKTQESAILSSQLMALMSTHPMTEDRIDALNEMMDNLDSAAPSFRSFNVDYNDFKKRVSEAADARPDQPDQKTKAEE